MQRPLFVVVSQCRRGDRERRIGQWRRRSTVDRRRRLGHQPERTASRRVVTCTGSSAGPLNRRKRGACRRTAPPVLGAKSTATGEAPAGGRGGPVRRHPLDRVDSSASRSKPAWKAADCSTETYAVDWGYLSQGDTPTHILRRAD